MGVCPYFLWWGDDCSVLRQSWESKSPSMREAERGFCSYPYRIFKVYRFKRAHEASLGAVAVPVFSDYKKNGFTFFQVGTGDIIYLGGLRPFRQHHSHSYPAVREPNGKLSERYGLILSNERTLIGKHIAWLIQAAPFVNLSTRALLTFGCKTSCYTDARERCLTDAP